LACNLGPATLALQPCPCTPGAATAEAATPARPRCNPTHLACNPACPTLQPGASRLQRCVLEAATLGAHAATRTACVPGCGPACSGCSPTLCAGGLQPVAQDRGCGPVGRGVHAAVGRGDGAQRADDVRPPPQVRGAAAAEATGRDRGGEATTGGSGALPEAWPFLNPDTVRGVGGGSGESLGARY